MAKFNLGILSGVTGKVGTVVGYKRYGIECMRAYIRHIKNPNTKEQQLARARLGVLSSTSRAFTPACNIGLAVRASDNHRSPSNEFMKLNYAALQGDSPSQVEVDYSQVKVSDGNLPMPGFASASATEALTVDVTWTPNSDMPKASTQDQVYIFVYQEELNGGVLSTSALRSAGATHVAVPSGWSGMRVQVYGFAVGNGIDNKGMRSYSAYLGSTVIV